MRVKFILPALTEARGKHWRPIKYSLFPPLGLATLAGYLDDSDEAEIVDEHVERLRLDDEPDLVAIETYVTSAYRAYRIADEYRRRGVRVVMGGLHVTACPEEAAQHADTIVLGPAEEAWPRFLADFRRGHAVPVYRSTRRDLNSLPPLRRDLIKRGNYLVPNSISVSRGCPHRCDFCYGNSFFRGGEHFYTVPVRRALEEIRSLPGRHLFFLDDNIFGDREFAASLFRGMRGMGRVWQGAATVRSVLDTNLLDLRVGHKAGNRDGHVPHSHSVPRHGSLPEVFRGGPHHAPQLGSLRHATRGVQPPTNGPRRVGNGVPERLRKLLRVEQHRPIRPSQGHHFRRGAPHCVRCRVEEMRPAVGRDHSSEETESCRPGP